MRVEPYVVLGASITHSRNPRRAAFGQPGTRAEHAIVCHIFETTTLENPVVPHRYSPLEKSVQRDCLHGSKPQLRRSLRIPYPRCANSLRVHIGATAMIWLHRSYDQTSYHATSRIQGFVGKVTATSSALHISWTDTSRKCRPYCGPPKSSHHLRV